MGYLNTFPVSYKVKGRRVVIVGGGAEALNKARLLDKTSAAVMVVSRRFEADFSELAVRLESRPFATADLDGAALVFVAEAGPDAALAKSEARRRNIPLNVVDVPAECDFYTPSIVERAPLTVAISTEGDAPVLARLVRARIEAMLAPGLGKIASLAGSLRPAAESLIHDGAQRRRFYEALVSLPAIADAVARGEGQAAGEKLLARHAGGQSAGAVWVIGAGPGEEDLLTLRAQRLLQEADVVVHDRFVPLAVVEMGRRDAERIAASGAQAGALAARLARQGRRVAWLKAGDPSLLGLRGEDIAALRRAGVDYQIVPGVSAPLGTSHVKVA